MSSLNILDKRLLLSRVREWGLKNNADIRGYVKSKESKEKGKQRENNKELSNNALCVLSIKGVSAL